MNKLKEVRNKLGLSQEKLGCLLDLPQSTICKYETGTYKIPLKYVVILKRLCNSHQIEFNIEDLLDED